MPRNNKREGGKAKERGRRGRSAPRGHTSAAGKPRVEVWELPVEIDEDGYDDVNNDGDALAMKLGDRSKLIWHSIGNIARDKGLDYQQDSNYIDARLTEKGVQQALGASKLVASWRERPTLVVASAMTRAIQTAALMFGELIERGEAQLIIRPEIREFWPDNIENCGRSLESLRSCPLLAELDAVQEALSEESTIEWEDAWDAGQANGGSGEWQKHCASGKRLEQFRVWLAARPEQRIAVVSHWGAINNLLNREPWTNSREKFHVGDGWFPESWPEDGIAQMFGMPNCGWVAVQYSEAGG